MRLQFNTSAMRHALAKFACALGLLSFASNASAQETDLIAPGVKVEKLHGDFKFTEGPIADKDGNVYFSDIPNNRIHKYSVDGKLGTFIEKSGGANGLAFDKYGNLWACEGGARQVTWFTPDGERHVAMDRYNEKKLNSPNDIWIDPKGGVYFTDPRYGKSDDLEQDGQHVYYLAPPYHKTITRVAADLKKPNGIIGTADGKLLYITDPGASKTYVYKINEDGSLADKKLFCEQGSDGMALDERGNLYLTSKTVTIYDSTGKLLTKIEVPEGPANCKFCGKEHKTLFITARTGLYKIEMRVKGMK